MSVISVKAEMRNKILLFIHLHTGVFTNAASCNERSWGIGSHESIWTLDGHLRSLQLLLFCHLLHRRKHTQNGHWIATRLNVCLVNYSLTLKIALN